MKPAHTFSLILLLCLLSTCDVKKKLSRKKESTETNTEQESISSKRQQLTEDWALVQGNLFHRNGILWIELDSIAQINLTPSGMTVIGYNPVIQGQITTTQKDTTIATGSTTLLVAQDSTTRKKTGKKSKSESTDKEKEQKSQKIAPILVLAILLIIAILYSSKKLNQ